MSHADPPAPCCPAAEPSPCVGCAPPRPDRDARRAAVPDLHAAGRSVNQIAKTLRLRRPAVRKVLASAGLAEHRPPPAGHKRPSNQSAERLAAVAVGVMAQRLDDSFGLVLAGVVEELEGVFRGLGADELEALGRSLTIRLIQTAVGIWFPSEYADGDPAEHLAGRRDVLRGRAERERRAGRAAEADHWEAVARSCDAGGELVPPSGVLQRVSPDGFRALVDRLSTLVGSSWAVGPAHLRQTE